MDVLTRKVAGVAGDAGERNLALLGVETICELRMDEMRRQILLLFIRFYCLRQNILGMMVRGRNYSNNKTPQNHLPFR